jgi:hypothetical protein
MRNIEFEPDGEEEEYEEMQRFIAEQERAYKYITQEHGYTDENIQTLVDSFAAHITPYIEHQLPQISPLLRLSLDQQALITRITQRMQNNTFDKNTVQRLDSLKRPELVTNYYTHTITDFDPDDMHADHLKITWNVLNNAPKAVEFYGRNPQGEIVKDIYFRFLPEPPVNESIIRQHMELSQQEQIYIPDDMSHINIGQTTMRKYNMSDILHTTYAYTGSFHIPTTPNNLWYIYGCSEAAFRHNIRLN